MLHILIIAMFMVVVLHDQLPEVLGAAGSGGLGGWAWLTSLVPMALLAGATWLVVGTLAREVERRGTYRAAILAERMLVVSRWAAVLLYAADVLAIGLLDQVRRTIGDLIALDELAVMSLPILVFLVGWWAFEPIERRLRESTTLRMLDQGLPVFTAPTRWQYVVLNFRHQVLLSLVPIGIIAIWSESLDNILAWLANSAGRADLLGRVGRQITDEGTRQWVHTVLQISGVIVVFTLSPVVLRRVWDTVRLAPGPLRSRLAAICSASGVRVRDVLVWRTHGTMINGAVIGLVGPLRYILLTDALLEHLPVRQVEAVMAHEVGHARHKHMPWLALSMLTGISVAAAAIGVVTVLAVEVLSNTGRDRLAEFLDGSLAFNGVMTLVSLVLGLGWFGFVSRRFEWQADAFAAQALSRVRPSPVDGPTLWDVQPAHVGPAGPEQRSITPEAVAAMTQALEQVAALNHMSRDRRSWRHGSIAYRQRRLHAIVGEPLERLRIDRTVRRLKWALAAALTAIVGLSVWAQF